MRGPQIGYEREYTDEDWKYGHDSFLTFSDSMRKHDAIYVGEWGGGGLIITVVETKPAPHQ